MKDEMLKGIKRLAVLGLVGLMAWPRFLQAGEEAARPGIPSVPSLGLPSGAQQLPPALLAQIQSLNARGLTPEMLAGLLSRAGTLLPAAASPAEAPKGPEAARERLAEVGRSLEAMPQGGDASDGASRSGAEQAAAAMTGGKLIGGGDASAAVAVEPGSLEQEIQRAQGVIESIRAEIAKDILGQKEMVDGAIIGLIAAAPVLLEGKPGGGKTKMVKSLAAAIHARYKRVQGSPDLQPGDIVGVEVLQEDPETGKKHYVFMKGPIFGDIVLFDEINRTPPKTQAAPLEAMQEHAVTKGDQTHQLSDNHFVIATQNPIEQEGTYPLPEALLDRFMFKALVTPNSREQNKAINDMNPLEKKAIKAAKVAELKDLENIRALANRVALSEEIKDYIVDLTRAPGERSEFEKIVRRDAYTFERAGIYLTHASKIHALMSGRAYVSPEDVRAVAFMVMRHRIQLTYEAADQTPDQVIQKILDIVPVPGSEQAADAAKAKKGWRRFLWPFGRKAAAKKP